MALLSIPPFRRARGFTLLEVALIIAIIGMMILMIVGYLLAPKKKSGPLPPIPPKEKAPAVRPAIATPRPEAPSAPSPVPPAAAPETPAPEAAPPKTIELSPDAVPTFR